jgi:hypothetical protein
LQPASRDQWPSEFLMVCTRTPFSIALAVMLVSVAALPGTLHAQETAPEDVLRAKGLTRAGIVYVLETDAQLADRLRTVRQAQALIEANAKKRLAIEREIKAADATMATLEADFRDASAAVAKTKRTAKDYNQHVTRMNILGSQLRDGFRYKTERQKALKEVPDVTDGYIEALVDLSDGMEATAKRYEAVAADPAVTAALARLNATLGRR